MALLLADIESIKNLIVEPLAKEIKEVKESIKALHTPDTCEHLKEVSKKLDKVADQQKLWLGGITVIWGVIGLVITFKDSIIQLFRR